MNSSSAQTTSAPSQAQILSDEPAATTASTRAELLESARLGFVRLRKDFVQRESAPRASVLADLVGARSRLALDLLLSVHALQPILEDNPLYAKTWARFLGRDVTARQVTTTLRLLEGRHLLEVEGPSRRPTINLLREDGSGEVKTRGGDGASGRGFFTLPFGYWTDGYIDRLKMPGKAMLLVMLRETQDPKGHTAFKMANARAPQFYGFSERTAERGYQELRAEMLTTERTRRVTDNRSEQGFRIEWFRTLVDPFSTGSRETLRKEAAAAAKKKAQSRS